jgi:hypothetical protein
MVTVVAATASSDEPSMISCHDAMGTTDAQTRNYSATVTVEMKVTDPTSITG